MNQWHNVGALWARSSIGWQRFVAPLSGSSNLLFYGKLLFCYTTYNFFIRQLSLSWTLFDYLQLFVSSILESDF